MIFEMCNFLLTSLCDFLLMILCNFECKIFIDCFFFCPDSLDYFQQPIIMFNYHTMIAKAMMHHYQHDNFSNIEIQLSYEYFIKILMPNGYVMIVYIMTMK